jgi:PEGA domain
MAKKTATPRALARARRALSIGVMAMPLAHGGVLRTASAQDASASDTAAARSLAVEGLKLAEAGHCAEAIDKLTRAERLRHAPIVLGRLGECEVMRGRLVDGTEMLRRVLREPSPPNPSAPLLKARERAQAALDAATPRIAALIVSVRGPREDGALVTIDGQPISSALLGADRPTDPGEHVVEVEATGFLKATRRVTLAPGEKRGVAVELVPDPKAAIAIGAPPPRAIVPAPREQESAPATEARGGEEPRSPRRAPAYAFWLLGGAAIGVGTAFGVVAWKGKRDLDGVCTANVCPAASQDRLDSAMRAADISTVALGIGAAGIALGTILFATAGSRSNSDAGAPRARRARAWLGIGAGGIAADF